MSGTNLAVANSTIVIVPQCSPHSGNASMGWRLVSSTVSTTSTSTSHASNRIPGTVYSRRKKTTQHPSRAVLAKIKAKQEANGVSVLPSKPPVTSMSLKPRTIWNRTCDAFSKFDRFVHGLVPAFPGAMAQSDESCPAAETKEKTVLSVIEVEDASATTGSKPRPSNSPVPGLNDFRNDMAKWGFTFKASPSLLARKDQSLTGVTLLIPDTDEETLQSIRMILNKYISPERGDIVLIQAPPHGGDNADWNPLCAVYFPDHEDISAQVCIGIEDETTHKIIEQHFAALQVKVLAVLDALCISGQPSACKLEKDFFAALFANDEGTVLNLTETIFKLIDSLPTSELVPVWKEFRAFTEASEQYRNFMKFASVPAHSMNLFNNIEYHADESHLTIAILRLHLVNALKDHMMTKMDTVVIARRPDLANAELNVKDWE